MSQLLEAFSAIAMWTSDYPDRHVLDQNPLAFILRTYSMLPVICTAKQAPQRTAASPSRKRRPLQKSRDVDKATWF